MDETLTEVTNTTTKLIKTEIKSKKVIVKTENHGGICSFCAYKTTHSGQLREHQRKHTGERPEICSFCSKGFSQKKTLEAHERLHTGEKPYKCKFCDVCFSQRNGVNSHVKSQHKDELVCGSEKVYEYI